MASLTNALIPNIAKRLVAGSAIDDNNFKIMHGSFRHPGSHFDHSNPG
jgi:hypothetical protein